ncbi:MAG: Eco57I restriction-modification methylase domain-containing protein [Muribaculaceae bacterium]|nr:Eco57I restriction-modification methylase domain-containing protein [Muribaculaceae bacterium]
MKTVLKDFITKPLFDASAEMLEHLHIQFSSQSKTPIDFGNFYVEATSQKMPKQLSEVVDKVKETYFIGAIDEETLEGHQTTYDLDAPIDGKYQTMMVFAVDIKHGETMTRNELAILTRGFNRLASSLPVILFVKNGNRLSLATCERLEYNQNWRDGEKLGKVSILRDINLEHPHRGHLDILESLGDKAYPTFDELYKHWLDVFSSELLTKKFYTELSEWYAWVIGSGKVKFPNDIKTTEDDTKYNHEAVIRLITRLIFVWFLKQKKLIPEEFFDENAIRENFIENFDPHSTDTIFYNPEESKYYRLILQNLFFAMLNRPIVDEESGNEENRRFRKERTFQGKNDDFNINNLLRYKSEFKEGGADKLLEIANKTVPFLNGGLFECLDHKDKEDPEYGMYYDGFTENSVARKQLSFPDYFFFGEEVGKDIDLSIWYDDETKTHQKISGLIPILQRYNFTVEENTPLDQEVSLDPELLGKAFENLLASYNPETKTSARKQTGSFYTPRDIVNYMVDESLIEYLKRACPSINNETIKKLFNYSDDIFEVPEEERKVLISALHKCKVLDPACGSGAFPMGILQQMVHALRKLDPTNEIWREFILELALGKDREAYENIKDKEELATRRRDIEESFNRTVNDPDYARKLYLIENCIFGVDIQPIATQISKLRFFISLVAEQNPTNDPHTNFGIRPLPNLEAKIVAANTLLSLEENNLFTGSSTISALKKQLENANHKLFIAKHNSQKRLIREEIRNIRKGYLDELKELGAINEDGAVKLAKWDMFDQNNYANFFDAQWMFGTTEGFDIIIANPPYVVSKKSDWPQYKWNTDLYKMFFECSCKTGKGFAKKQSIICYITPKFYLLNKDDKEQRKFFMSKVKLLSLTLCNPFDAITENVITIFAIEPQDQNYVAIYKYQKDIKDFISLPKLSISYSFSNENYEMVLGLDEKLINLLNKIKSNNILLREISSSKRGAEVGKKYLREQQSGMPALIGLDTSKYSIQWDNTFLPLHHKEHKRLKDFFNKPLIYIRRVDSCISATKAPQDKTFAFNKNIYGISLSDGIEYSSDFILGWLNSKLVDFYYKKRFSTKKEEAFPEIQTYLYEQLPLPKFDKKYVPKVECLVKKLLEIGQFDPSIQKEIDKYIYKMYGLSFEEILLIDPEITITKEEFKIL